MNAKFLLSVLGVIAAALAVHAAPATAEPNAPAAPKPTTAELAAAIAKNPIIFYLAKGEPDACGQGCSEWIGTDGQFDTDAPRRLRDLLNRLGKRKLPIFFHSSGGLTRSGMAVGRLLRERGITAGVSRTVPAGCLGVTEEACRDVKRSGQPVMAELNSLASCNSSCVYAFVGAKVRHVPPGARLGVHTSKPVERDPDPRAVAASQRNVSQYLQEMQIAPGVFELISKTPFEQIHYLSRDEIAAFGIDARAFEETRWLVSGTRSPVIVKFVLEAKGAGGKEFRTSMIRLRCVPQQQQRLLIDYVRGLASDEIGATKTIKLVSEGRDVVFSQNARISKIDAINPGASFDTRAAYEPPAFLRTAAGNGSIDIVETDPANPAAPPHNTKLSTHGLSDALEKLRNSCELPSDPPAAPAVKQPDQPGEGSKK